jgi:hypothetical protein
MPFQGPKKHTVPVVLDEELIIRVGSVNGFIISGSVSGFKTL